MSASVRRRLSALERTKTTAAPALLLIVNRAGTEHGRDDDQIIGIDGDGTRPAVDRLNGEGVDSLVNRAKAQIVGGGVHLIRFRRKTQ